MFGPGATVFTTTLQGPADAADGQHATTPEHIARCLVELANQRGGRDNATVVLAIVGSAP